MPPSSWNADLSNKHVGSRWKGGWNTKSGNTKKRDGSVRHREAELFRARRELRTNEWLDVGCVVKPLSATLVQVYSLEKHNGNS